MAGMTGMADIMARFGSLLAKPRELLPATVVFGQKPPRRTDSRM